MSGKTPGQVACEAFWDETGAGPLGQEPGSAWKWAEEVNAHDAWEAAAKAAIDESDSTALAQLAMAREAIDDLADERDRLTERVAELVSEGNQLRTLVAEILGHFGPSGSGHTARVGQVQIAKWKTLAGLTRETSETAT